MANTFIIAASSALLIFFARGVRRHWHTFAVLALLCTIQLHAEWITPKGKTYHTQRECIALRTTSKPEKISRTDAEKRGLRVCGICARSKKGQK